MLKKITITIASLIIIVTISFLLLAQFVGNAKGYNPNLAKRALTKDVFSEYDKDNHPTEVSYLSLNKIRSEYWNNLRAIPPKKDYESVVIIDTIIFGGHGIDWYGLSDGKCSYKRISNGEIHEQSNSCTFPSQIPDQYHPKNATHFVFWDGSYTFVYATTKGEKTQYRYTQNQGEPKDILDGQKSIDYLINNPWGESR